MQEGLLVGREDAAQGGTATQTLEVLAKSTSGKQCHTGKGSGPHVDRKAVKQ